MSKPDFIGIGAQKAGTTWLTRNLERHPGIWMAPQKELHYFDEKMHTRRPVALHALRNGAMGDRARRQLSSRKRIYKNNLSTTRLLWDLNYFLMPPTGRWYKSLFNPAGARLAGEFTPSYDIIDGESVERAHETLPDAKIIFFMRNPIEAAYSGFGMSQHLGQNRPFETYFDRARKRWHFEHSLAKWREFYPDEQIFVGFIEDIRFSPGRLLDRVLEFLGANTTERRLANRKIHAGQLTEAPVNIMRHIAREYLEELQSLSESFGGYADFWLYSAHAILEGEFDNDSIPHPLGESELWHEWARENPSFDPATHGKATPLRSKRLSEF